MKILHIIPTLGMGGAEKLLVDLLNASEDGVTDIDVAVLSNLDNVYESQVEQLCRRYFVSTSKAVYNISNIGFIRGILMSDRYDIVHCHLYAAQLFTPIAIHLVRGKLRPNLSLVTTEHSTSNRRRNKKVFKLLDTLMYRQFDSIVCISDGTREELVRYLPTLAEKTIVINNGIPLQALRDAEAADLTVILPNYNNEKVVLMVASLRHQKDPFTLIRAAKLLGPDYRIVFVGDGESSAEAHVYAEAQIGQAEIFEHIHTYGNVTFLGKRQDVPSLMKAATVFVLSSNWEGFGLVVVEAAAAGIPVIGSDVIGLSEVISHLRGQVFAVGSHKELADKIKLADGLPSADAERLNNYDIIHTSVAYKKLYKLLIEKMRAIK